MFAPKSTTTSLEFSRSRHAVFSGAGRALAYSGVAADAQVRVVLFRQRTFSAVPRQASADGLRQGPADSVLGVLAAVVVSVQRVSAAGFPVRPAAESATGSASGRGRLCRGSAAKDPARLLV